MANNYNMNEVDMLVPIYTDYIKKNPSWSNSNINVTGIVYHDVGVGTTTKTAEQWVARWNRPESNNSVHAIVTTTKTCIMMPCFETKGKAKKVWGVGAAKKGGPSFNSSRIQFESACSGELVYSGASFTIKNKTKAIKEETILRDNCVDFMARVCIFHGLDPLGKDKNGFPVIVDHATAFKLGWGSNHADIGEKIRGLPEVYPNLDYIRQMVKDRIEEIQMEEFIMSLKNENLFDEYMNSWLKRQNEKKVSTWAKKDVEWAEKNDFLVGNNGNLMPQGIVTREAMVSVLHRYDESKESK